LRINDLKDFYRVPWHHGKARPRIEDGKDGLRSKRKWTQSLHDLGWGAVDWSHVTQNASVGDSLTHGAEPILQLLDNFPAFMEPEGSLPFSQVPFSDPYPEPDRFNPYHPSLSL
jgi:hypothetical protein